MKFIFYIFTLKTFPGNNFDTYFDTLAAVAGAKLWAVGHFKKAYELLNLSALKFIPVHKMHILQCMGKVFCVEFQSVPLNFHIKYLTHTLKDAIFIQCWNFKIS